MSDNIIDFNAHRRERGDEAQGAELSMDALMDRLTELPQDNLIASVTEATNMRMLRMLILTDIAAQASRALRASGFDPDEFCVEEVSLNRFLSRDDFFMDGATWNGPFFDCELDDCQLRLTSTIRENGTDKDGNILSYTLLMDLFRLDDDDDDTWKHYENGEWADDGPPADAFDYLEQFRDSLDDEDWEDEDWEDEDEDWDAGWEEADEDSILNLDLNASTYGALAAAGIDSIARLREMSNGELLAIEGIDRRGLFIIKRALADWDDDGDAFE